MCSRTLCSLDTGYYADTVEWCSVKGFESYLVCGTYQLQEKISTDESQSSGNIRVGNLQLYCLDQSALGRLKKLQSFELGGVLDTKWLPTPLNECPVLGAVTSDGEVKIFYLKEKRLVEMTSFIASPQKLCLSLDCSSKDRNSVVAVSDSGGKISLCQFNEGTSTLCQTLQWTGHQYEAWITAFDAWNSAIVYSGGDDCLLKGWDTRTDCQRPTFASKRHDMGVCSIQCNVCHEHIVATGSYDENILLWDNRNMKQPLSSSHPGGGVWRIKWHPVHGNAMLTACMYEGFHILNFISSQGGQCLKKVLSYKEQASLAYGADWCRSDSQSSTKLLGHTVEQSLENLVLKDACTARTFTDIIATCSFYDHALNLWQVAL